MFLQLVSRPSCVGMVPLRSLSESRLHTGAVCGVWINATRMRHRPYAPLPIFSLAASRRLPRGEGDKGAVWLTISSDW